MAGRVPGMELDRSEQEVQDALMYDCVRHLTSNAARCDGFTLLRYPYRCAYQATRRAPNKSRADRAVRGLVRMRNERIAQS